MFGSLDVLKDGTLKWTSFSECHHHYFTDLHEIATDVFTAMLQDSHISHFVASMNRNTNCWIAWLPFLLVMLQTAVTERTATK